MAQKQSKRVLWKDGFRVAVLRPADPAKAIEAAKALVGKTGPEAQRMFNEILGMQPYTYVGLSDHHGKHLLDEDGHPLGKVQKGDSFVAYEQMVVSETATRRHEEEGIPMPTRDEMAAEARRLASAARDEERRAGR